MRNKIKIYREYIRGRASGEKAVSIAERLGLTRNALYSAVRRVTYGSARKIARCTADSALDCLWEYRYKKLWEAIPKNRRQEGERYVILLRDLIKKMRKDGFSAAQIAARIGKERNVVHYHLKNGGRTS